ncbi:hypothetical protein EVAR_70190_1 [Eumeta japonica]|uniref:Uncharacterized protein n=1 Tax=Eumeta variegata TaxID=151549 RepID=A0A4C1TH37_EUMVA|nr:hypothetical protein EVAR_70190_1 [Eumeta japonica]
MYLIQVGAPLLKRKDRVTAHVVPIRFGSCEKRRGKPKIVIQLWKKLGWFQPPAANYKRDKPAQTDRRQFRQM